MPNIEFPLSPGSFSEMPRISFRALTNGGSVQRAPRTTPADLLLSDEEVLLLIHGFANDEAAAFTSYRAFLQNLGTPWSARSAGIFWPGDGNTIDDNATRSRFSLLATFSYSWQPQRAKETARYLSDTLTRACKDRQAVFARRGRSARPLVISIVAHSMGCRLALELMSLLRAAIRAGDQLRVRNVSLMAAAVPTYQVGTRGDLELALTTPEKTTVYWSRRDSVLRFAFPLGQVLERPFPLGWRNRVAFGLKGAGAGGARSVQVELGHSDYWPSATIAADVLDQLGEKAGATGRKPPARRELLGRRPSTRNLC